MIMVTSSISDALDEGGRGGGSRGGGASEGGAGGGGATALHTW